MTATRDLPLTVTFILLCGPGVFAAADQRVHQTQVPWFVADKDSLSYNVAGGSFALRDAFGLSLSRVLFNGREVTTVRTGDDVDESLLSTGEFSRMGASSNYINWLSSDGYNSSDFENLVATRVNVSVQRPLDAHPGLHMGGAVEYNLNAQDVYDGNGFGSQGSFTFVDQFSEDRLGLMLVSSYEGLPVAETANTAWYWPYWDQGAGGILYAPSGYQGYAKGGRKDYIRNFAGLQWRPALTTEVNVDLLYSTRREDIHQRGYEISNIAAWPNIAVPTPPGREVFEGAMQGHPRFGSAFRAGSANSAFVDDESLLIAGVNLMLEQGAWTLKADVSHSASEGESSWKGVNSLNDNSTTPVLTLPGDGSFKFNQDLADTGQNAPGSLSVAANDAENRRSTVAIDLERELGFFSMESVEFGLRATDSDAFAMGSSAQAEPALSSSGEFGSALLGERSSGGIAYLLYDIDQAIDEHFGGGIPYGDFEKNHSSSVDVNDQTLAAYAKLEFSRKLNERFGMVGDVGLRAVEADTESRGYLVDWVTGGGVPVKTSVGHDLVRLLPSLNLAVFPFHGKYAGHFSAARKMAKPPVEMLRANTEVYSPWPGAPLVYAEGGNPSLDPWDIYQVDLGGQWHYMDKAYIAATASYKHLDTFVARGFRNETINGRSYSVLRPINVDDAYIASLSLRWNQPLSFLPYPFDHFGVFISGALNDSNAQELHDAPQDIRVSAMDDSYSLLGLADASIISSIYFSMGDFSIQVRRTYLSGYTSEIAGKIRSLATVGSKSEVDIRLSYMPTDKLSVLLELKNVTNEDYLYYYDNNERRPGGTIEYGTAVNMGVNYSF